MFLTFITNLSLLIAFTVIIFWPLYHHDKLQKMMSSKHPFIIIGSGIAFALLSTLITLLSVGILNGALINSRLIAIIYSGLIGGPISILVCSLTIFFTGFLWGHQ